VADPDAENIRDILRAELAPLRANVAALESAIAELAPLRDNVTALESTIRAWPDFHFLQAAALQQLDEAKAARDHRRNIEARLEEIYRLMPTDPEISKLREEVAKSIDDERPLKSV
jgi:hypothetical protein